MSFATFKYTEIINEEWENSTLRTFFESTRFMLAFFQIKDNETYFDGVIFWNMPIRLLDNEVKSVWDETLSVVRSGSIVKEVKANGIRKTNLPGMSLNNVCHVRPKAQNSSNSYPLPINDKLTNASSYMKHCFWLNNTFIESLRNNKDD